MTDRTFFAPRVWVLHRKGKHRFCPHFWLHPTLSRRRCWFCGQVEALKGVDE